MRCFVAMSVGDDIKVPVEQMVDELRAAVSEVSDDSPRLSWTRPEGWHVTLAFVGVIEAARIEEICRRLPAVASAIPAFTIKAAGVSTFPTRGRRPRALVVDIEDGGRTERLAEAVGEALEPLGFEREARRFSPHLTIARVRDHDGWPVFAGRLESWREREFGEHDVESIALYESKLGTDAARYSVLRRFPLARCTNARSAVTPTVVKT
jgi:2'-5' RNA ligase